MPRRLFPSCHAFRARHVEFVDGQLPAREQETMAAHLTSCLTCRAHDVRVRRSLMALQALPLIQPTAAFREALRRRLAASAAVEQAVGEAGKHSARLRMHSRSTARVHTA